MAESLYCLFEAITTLLIGYMHVCYVISVMSDSVAHGLSGSSVCGILQARMLEWVAMPSSRGSSQPGD